MRPLSLKNRASAARLNMQQDKLIPRNRIEARPGYEELY
jgi:hypothetical protein